MSRLLSFLLVLGLSAPPPVLAQAPQPIFPVDPPPITGGQGATIDTGASFKSLFTDLGHDVRKLPSRSNAITLGIAGLLALAVHPADRGITARATHARGLDEVFEPADPSGNGWTQAAAALATFAVGEATGNRRVQEVGADLVQAQLLSMAMTQTLKVAVDRSRPDDGKYSFPSGHTSSTFATATVLQRHFGWKVGVPAYGFATFVAASRVQENRHYASDVIFGAALGLVAGRTVTVGRGRGTFELTPLAVPGGAGVQFTAVHLH